MTRITPLLLLLLLILPAAGRAQDTIRLDDATIRRLGLVFTRLSESGTREGARVPARVISSPAMQADLVAQFDGVLVSWQVRPGDQVRNGDLLGLVRSPDVLALQRQWLEARAAERQAQALLGRDRQLFDDGVIAERRLQQAEREQQAALAELRTTAALLRTAGYSGSGLEALADASATLGDYRLLASGDGTIGHLHLLPGAAVRRGETLAGLNSAAAWLSAELPPMLATGLREGQELRVQGVDAGLLLRQLDRALDSDSQTIGLMAEFTEPVDLLPGRVVNLILPAPQRGLLVPADAVVHNGTETRLYVRTAEGVESRSIELRAYGGDYLATAGIEPGEQVVVRGAALLKGIELGLGGE